MDFKRYLSRKFLLTVAVVVLSSALPVAYKKADISETTTLVVLGILGGVGVAYGFINMKDAQPK